MSEPTKLQIPVAGYEVAADWYEGTSDEVLLVLIGFESNKAKYKDMVVALSEQTGTSALVLDYSGHGESPFELDEIRPAQHFLEVITAFDWIADNHPDKKINVMGTSYGGLMATQLTKYRGFNKLVLRVPAIYPPNFFYDKIKTFKDHKHFQDFRGKSTDELVGHPLLKRASEFKGSTLVVTHELDDICPKNVTDAFTEAFGAKAWTQPKFQHSMTQSAPDQATLDAYYQRIAEFLK